MCFSKQVQLGIQEAAAHTSTGLAKASVGGWDYAALVKHGRAQRCSCPWRRRNDLGESSRAVPPQPCSHSRTPGRSSICDPKELQQLFRPPKHQNSVWLPLSGTNSLPPPLPPSLPSADELLKKIGILWPQAEGFTSYPCVCSGVLTECGGHLLDVNSVLAVF